jgi:hypothetical protein
MKLKLSSLTCLVATLVGLLGAAFQPAGSEEGRVERGRYTKPTDGYQLLELRPGAQSYLLKGLDLTSIRPVGALSGMVLRVLVLGPGERSWEFLNACEPTSGVSVARVTELGTGWWAEHVALSEVVAPDFDAYLADYANLGSENYSAQPAVLRTSSGLLLRGVWTRHLLAPPYGPEKPEFGQDPDWPRLAASIPEALREHLKPLLTSLCPKPIQPGEESMPHFGYWSSLLCELKAALGIEQPLNPPWTVHTVGSPGLFERSFPPEALEVTTKFSHLAPTDPLPDAEVRRLLLEAREKGQRLRAEVAPAKLPGAADPKSEP